MVMMLKLGEIASQVWLPVSLYLAALLLAVYYAFYND